MTRSAYQRQQRYWASGLMGGPPVDPQMRALWMGWDAGWYMRKPWRRTTQAFAWYALFAALVHEARRAR
jgi:hypothetical protein